MDRLEVTGRRLALLSTAQAFSSLAGRNSFSANGNCLMNRFSEPLQHVNGRAVAWSVQHCVAQSSRLMYQFDNWKVDNFQADNFGHWKSQSDCMKLPKLSK